MSKIFIINKRINIVSLAIMFSLFLSTLLPINTYAKAYNADEKQYICFTGKVVKKHYKMYGSQDMVGYELKLNKKISMESEEYGKSKENRFLVWFDSVDEENEFKKNLGNSITVIGMLNAERGSSTAVGRYEKYALANSHIISEDLIKLSKATTHKDKNGYYFGYSSDIKLKKDGKKIIVSGSISMDTGFGPGYDIKVKGKKNIFIVSDKTKYSIPLDEGIDEKEVSAKDFLDEYKNYNQICIGVKNGKVAYIAAAHAIQL